MKLFFKFILLPFFILSCTNKICSNGATNSPKCDLCPPGRIFLDGQCAIQVTPEQGGK